MDLICAGVLAGVLGTMAMDAFNHLLARTGMLLKIDVAMIGRMSAGWTHGRFCYNHPDEMQPVSWERPCGYITHYAIGIVLALGYVLGWHFLVGGPASPVWALTYGFATTIVSLFYVYPSMGLGVIGWRSPAGIKATLSPLANHLFFGAGMALAITLV